MAMENNTKRTGSCIVINDNKVLLVKHTYGAAAGKYLIPGGFSEINELPEKTAEREVFEETGVKVNVKNLVAVRFTIEEVWCVFDAEYLSGEPKSDLRENDSAIFMDLDQAMESIDVVETTRILLKSFIDSKKQFLTKSDFVNSKFTKDTWQLFI